MRDQNHDSSNTTDTNLQTAPVEPIAPQASDPSSVLTHSVATAVARIVGMSILFYGGMYLLWLPTSVLNLQVARSEHEVDYYRLKIFTECAALTYHIVVGALAIRFAPKIARYVCPPRA